MLQRWILVSVLLPEVKQTETGYFASLPFRPLHTELLNIVPTHHINYG